MKFWALTASIAAHAAVLTIFAAVKLSQSGPVLLQTATVLNISQAGLLADRPSITPKPKVSPANRGRPMVGTTGHRPSADFRQIFDAPRPDYRQPQEELPAQPVRSEPAAEAGNNELAAQTEFFGSPAEGRRICYVVDCSGSMQGLWQQVRKELCESIQQLQADQYFCVIVFGAGSILESGGGQMVRATGKTKKDAYDFIGSVLPRGTTNATAALEHAVKIRDRMGVAPSLVYFLTDGFELSEQDGSRFAHEVGTMLRSFSPKTQINTIGFWCGEQDRRVLDMIAKESGGQFTPVDEVGNSSDWQ